MNHTLQHISDLPEEKESYLQVLWNKIEKYEVRNQKAEQKVDVLYKEYDSVIIPHEKTKASCQCRLIEHLMTFLSLKQIRPQDRERLFAYLSHEIATLHDFAMFCDMDVLNSLGENLNKHQDKYFHQEKKQALDDACWKCIYLVVYATLLMKVSCTQLSHSSGQLLLQTAALTDSTA